ncbi:MAG: hypothetical protein V1789_08445 [PVC group bacterium]
MNKVQMMTARRIPLVPSLLCAVLLAGCASTPPRNLDDICAIFEEKPDWYRDAKDSYRKWKVPIPVMMAIIHQESRFHADARPPRTKLLGFIPWTRSSTSYGYAQALESTWDIYVKNTGNREAKRDDFGDVVDFVGWYCARSHRKCRISKQDAYNLYLAYHEGWDGFNAHTYRGQGWLINVARKVKNRASLYSAQLGRCREELDRKKSKKFLGIF